MVPLILVTQLKHEYAHTYSSNSNVHFRAPNVTHFLTGLESIDNCALKLTYGVPIVAVDLDRLFDREIGNFSTTHALRH